MHRMATVQRITAQEYLATYDETFPRCELIEGEVVVSEPGLIHQRVCREMFRALDAWTEATPRRGEVTFPIDVLIDDRNVFAPDLLWYAEGHVPQPEDRPYPVPDLVVEVRSPSTWRYDVGAKKAAYERNGLQELWLIDARVSELLAFRRSAPGVPTFDVALEVGARDTLSSPLLPGFELLLGTLFGG
jgi:Uma2 family endonuclease